MFSGVEKEWIGKKLVKRLKDRELKDLRIVRNLGIVDKFNF